MELLDKYIGHWGRYQAFVYCLLCTNFIFTGTQMMTFTFTGAVPSGRCILPNVDTKISNKSSSDNLSYHNPQVIDHMRHFYIKPQQQRGVPMYCSYCPAATDVTQGVPTALELNKTCPVNGSIECDAGYIYDRTQFYATITSKFDLVCHKGAWKRQLASSLYMAGVFVGAQLGGYLGDRFGRRKVFLVMQFTAIITTHLVILVPYFEIFCILQVVNAALTYGAYMSGYVIAMELTGGLARTIAGVWVQGIFAIGYVYVGVMAYLIRDWQYLQLALCLPGLLTIPCYWLLPESIRWLVVHGRMDEAKAILIRAMKFNGKEVLDARLDEALQDEGGNVTEASVKDLFRYRVLTIMTLIVFYSWFTCSMTYYGISYNTTDLPGDIYVNFIISGLIEFPGYVICIPMLERWGRRITMMTFFGFGGLCIIICPFLPKTVNWLIITLASIGKLGAAAAFAVIYNYSAELFPTVVRNGGLGFASSFSRVASISAPQIALLGTYVATWLPFLIYGLCAAVGAVLVFFLPETKGKGLPETIQDGLLLASKKRVQFSVKKPKRNFKEVGRDGEAEIFV